jgi:hypothetical protein
MNNIEQAKNDIASAEGSFVDTWQRTFIYTFPHP